MRSPLFLALLSLSTIIGCTPGIVPMYEPDDTDSGSNEEPEPTIDTDADGWSVEDGDCNDADPAINPGAVEICDGIDNDCSGESDDVIDNVWYLDADLDGYGGDISLVDGCEVESTSAWVGSSTDCDDGNAEINPGATEVCNDIDDDCDSTTDEDDAADATTWFADEDGDSYGDPSTSLGACDAPSGYVADATDCNDANPLVNPGQAEVCDELDNDCDGDVDEEVTTTFYADTDGDGYGDSSSSSTSCTAPSGTVSDDSDCDDGDSSSYPGATEYCDDIDNDCDGDIDPDDSVDASIWYTDTDSDGYGDSSSSTESCTAPSGTVSDATDCDDTDASVNPAATEVCDDIDNDCDGSIDPSTSTDAGTWYVDFDDDSYGDVSSFFVSCESPVGYTADSTDCDDGDSSSYPGATEVCDSVDNDCDGDIDPDSSVDAATWYVDIDEDGYGDIDSSTESCSVPSGFVEDDTDCDDTDDAVNPGQAEVCDELDNDCDGEVDEDVENTFYGDWDNDGWGNVDIVEFSCEAPSGFVEDDTDCDDTDEEINPGAIEVCDEIDNDCDGDIDDADQSTDEASMSEFYADADADTFGDVDASYVSCEAPSGYVEDSTDCDDTDSTSYPDAPETCDGADNDCDGSTDENLSSDWYVDNDGDLFGAGESIAVICDGSTGSLVDNATDCDDTDAEVNPDASEVCDEIDNNCDGDVDEEVTTTFYADSDSDGYGDSTVSDDVCEASSGFVEDDTDCDDTDSDVNPDATEVDANGIDDDCDGGVDDLGIYCCLDSDSDGYGDPLYCVYEGTGVCDSDSGYVEGDGDCDDGNYSYHPGALDVSGDSIDSDCDGDTDA